MGVFTMVGGKLVEKTFKKTAKKAAKKAAPKKKPAVAKDDKVTKPKRGRPTKAQRAARTRALKKQQAAAAAKAQAPKRVRTKRQDLSGLTKEQRTERRNLIEASNIENKLSRRGIDKYVLPSKVLTLTPEGEKLAKQGKFKELLTKRRRYTYERTDAPSTSPDRLAQFEIFPRGKARREAMANAFNNMGKQEKIEFIKKAEGPKLTATQINEIVGQGGTKFKVVQQSIRKIMEKAKREGYPTTLKGLREAQKKRGKVKPQSRQKVTAEVERQTTKAKKTITSKINSKAAVARSKIGKAVQEGTMTKTMAQRLNNKIETRRKNNIDRAMKNLEAGKAADVEAILKKFPFMGSSPTKIGTTTAPARKAGGKVVPKKMKGFSKLPEKVQRKMNPKMAAKYKGGGRIKSPRGCGAALRGYGKAMK